MKKHWVAVGISASFLAAGSLGATGRERQIRVGDLYVSGVADSGYRLDFLHDANHRLVGQKFLIPGSPQLVAQIPSKHLVMKASKVQGQADAAGVVRSADLTGGVSATIEAKSDFGPEVLAMQSATVHYAQAGVGNAMDAKFTFANPVVLTAKNPAPQSMKLTGKSGSARVAPVAGAELGLAGANLDGDVMGDFQGALVQGGKKVRSHVHATAEHLVVQRGGDDGTDYLVEFSGSVNIQATGQGIDLDFDTPKIIIVLDKNRIIKSVGGGEDAGDTHGTIKQTSR